MKKIVAVIGDSVIEKKSLKYKIAYEVGQALIDNGYRIQTGGMGGVMKATFEGAHSSKKYQDGDTISILPSFNKTISNGLGDILIATGLDIGRNVLDVNADFVVVIGGGAGTMAEIASAWSLFRPIVAFDNVEGWSQKVAGTKIDHRKRYDFDDKVFAVSSVEQMIAVINSKIGLYTRYHQGIGKSHD